MQISNRLIHALWCACVIQAAAQVGDNSLDDHRRFALSHAGDPANGQKVFADARLGCANCHALTGQEKCGPNLEGVGDKYGREELVGAIIRPNDFILPGYHTTLIRTKDGNEYMGVLYLVTKAEHRIGVATGERVRINRANFLDERVLPKSMMPEGLAAGMTKQEFSDLVAFLETLKIAPLTGFKSATEPVEIAILKRRVELRPFHGADIRFKGPVWFGPIPGLINQFAILEHQEGKIWRLEKGPKGERSDLFLDISNEVTVGPVEGLMCVAFHPAFIENRRYFLKFETREEGQLKTVVVERLASEDFLRDSGRAARRLFEVKQPAPNHNGGCLVFGPDKFLYLGFGDGGPQRDPLGYCQNPRDALGSMLRIDVDSRAEGKPYGIPLENPFLRMHEKDPEVMPETWAIGFREPWRFSFDTLTGELWVGDVGQDRFEEVSIVRRGENHGWNVWEAFEAFSDQYRRAEETYVPPIFAYPHSFGVSVTGGHVYRGNTNSSFYGAYIFGDYESRRLWALTQKDRKLEKIREIGRSPARIASFGVDAAGELYVVGYDTGTIYHLDLSGARFE